MGKGDRDEGMFETNRDPLFWPLTFLQVSWAADSRLICSGSSDSTLKVWDVKKGKILLDLPGHADEVYAVDWSPDGQRVASGGKDKVLKL